MTQNVEQQQHLNNIDNLNVKIVESLERLDKKLDKLNTLVSGNGEPQKGLIVRVDRLEQMKRPCDIHGKKFVDFEDRISKLEENVNLMLADRENRKWVYRTLWGAAFTLLVTAITWFAKGVHKLLEHMP